MGALDALGDLIFPPHCAVCETAIDSGEWLCSACLKEVRPLRPPRCEACSHPLSGEIPSRFVCPNCRDAPFEFEFAAAALRAGGSAREMIHRLKYAGERRLAEPLGSWLVDALADDRFGDFDIDLLVPVPLHPTRRRDRGYNQSALLAAVASRHTGIPWSEALQRTRYTETQTHLDRIHRMRNLQEAFQVRQNANVKHLRIALIDDVLTTGSTLDGCARALLAAGAERVAAATVARG